MHPVVKMLIFGAAVYLGARFLPSDAVTIMAILATCVVVAAVWLSARSVGGWSNLVQRIKDDVDRH